MPGIDDFDDTKKEEFKEDAPKRKSPINLFYLGLIAVTVLCIGSFVYIFFLAPTGAPKKELAPGQENKPKTTIENPIDPAKVTQAQTVVAPPPLKKPFEENPIDLEKIAQAPKGNETPVNASMNEISTKIKEKIETQKEEPQPKRQPQKAESKDVREWAIELYKNSDLLINLKKDAFMVDGKAYRVGDVIDNFMIVDITPNYVRFSDKKESMFYNLRFIEVMK